MLQKSVVSDYKNKIGFYKTRLGWFKFLKYSLFNYQAYAVASFSMTHQSRVPKCP